MNNRPLLFFAFANSPARYLPNLKTEERGILKHFTPLKHLSQIVDFEHREQTSAKDFFNILSQIGDKITVLHYSGHAGSMSMELDDGDFSIERLCTLISGLEKLELVFLNGCSTGPMVDLLLEKGVKAVIATSEEVADNKACDFSLAFYEAMTVKGKNLKKAFTEAIGTLKNSPIKETDAFISRASVLRDRSAGNASSEKIQWALYHKEAHKHILDWTLVKTAGLTNIDPALREKIEAKRRTIDQEEQIVATIETEKQQLQVAIEQLGATNPVSVGLQTQVDQKQQRLDLVEEKLVLLYTELKAIIQGHDRLAIKSNFKKSLLQLNYITQLQFFEQEFEKIGAYILQGSPQCGQDLLKEHLLHIAGFRTAFKNEFYHEVYIDFSAQAFSIFSVKEIWVSIKEQLLEIATTEPKAIVQEIHDKYYQTKSILFIFNNIHQSSPAFNQKIIEEFWFEFLEMFLPNLANTNTDSKVLLFVIDKNCQLIQEGDVVLSKKEKAWKAAWKAADIAKFPTHIVPIVEPLKAKELADWKLQQRLPLELGLTTEKLKELILEGKGFIVPTIKRLCQSAGMEDIYFKEFAKYEYQLPEL